MRIAGNLKVFEEYEGYKRSAKGIGALIANVVAWSEAVKIAAENRKYTEFSIDEQPRPKRAGELKLDDDSSISLGTGEWVDLLGEFIEITVPVSPEKSKLETPLLITTIIPFDRIISARLDSKFLARAARAKYDLTVALEKMSKTSEAWEELNAALTALNNLPVSMKGRFGSGTAIRDASAMFTIN